MPGRPGRQSPGLRLAGHLHELAGLEGWAVNSCRCSAPWTSCSGRGVDQILPHPGDASLPEACVTGARTYVELAQAANGTESPSDGETGLSTVDLLEPPR
ncbi:hypothetical protein ABT237_39615 [Streptomyces sp. NPDC001581]|uniref:hypothetical protein n=1 Tax=Streptomyces sp. NPDC001581 TaxID=3154386 RepID=UPI003317E580